MQWWVALAGLLAMIALILTAFGLMLGIVKPADALRRVGAILGVIMLLMVLPAVLVNLWSGPVATVRFGSDWGWRMPVETIVKI